MAIYLQEISSAIDKIPENSLSRFIDKLISLIELRALSCIQIANKQSLKSCVRYSL